MASSIGIFDLNDRSDQLAITWARHYAEVEAERLQPYADLFLDLVVWPDILRQKDEIFASLKEKCSTAKKPHELKVPIFSFNHVYEYPKRFGMPASGPAYAYAVSEGDKDALRVRQIHDNGWRPWMVLQQIDEEGDLEDYLSGVALISWSSLMAVVKKTDFCQQLAARFGRNYWVNVESEGFNWETDLSGESFSRHTISLQLNYFPYGLPDHYQEKKEKFMDKMAARERRVLGRGEKFIYWNGQKNIFHNPLSPPPSLSTSLPFSTFSPSLLSSVFRSEWDRNELRCSNTTDCPPPPKPVQLLGSGRGIFMPCSNGSGGVVLKDISRAL